MRAALHVLATIVVVPYVVLASAFVILRHAISRGSLWSVLDALLRAEGRIVSAEQLLEQSWDDQADPFTTSVRVIVSRLRSKLGDPPLIETVVGRGYRIG